MTYTDYLTTRIKTYDYGEPIYASSLANDLSLKYSLSKDKSLRACAVAIKRLLDNEKIKGLKTYQKGIYYLSKKTSFGDSKIDKNKIIYEKYLKDDNGYFAGADILNKIGLSTQMSKDIVVVSNNCYDCLRKNKKLGVIVKPPKTKINNDNKKYLQFLDIIELIDKNYINEKNPYKLLSKYIKDNKLDYKKLFTLSKDLYNDHVSLRLMGIYCEG